MRLNLLAGFASSAWSALIMLAVVPLYIKYLGIEAYGLIGFFATTQALLQLLDMGLAPTINREVARASASGNLQDAGKLLHSLAIIYWGMAGVIALLIVALATLIAGYWLHSRNIPQQTITHAVMLMGLVVACRWPVGVYQGAVMGAQRLAVSSSINMVMVTLGSVGALVVLAYVSPTIEAFFIWQACVGLAYAIAMRWAAWRIIGRMKCLQFNVDQLKQIWRFSAGMSGVAVSAIILMQLDKVLLSRLLSLEDFGRYALAGMVASGLYVILTPTFNVIYPRLSALVLTGDTEKLIDLYRSGTRLLSSVLFPLAIAATIASEDLVALWTGDRELALSLAEIIPFLLIGTAMNGVMHFPYALQLAFGMTRLPLIITLVLIVVLVPITIFLTLSYGVVGGGMAWLLLNSLYLLFGTWLTHRYLLRGMAIDWLVRDVGAPFCISIITVAGGWQLANMNGDHFSNLLLSCGLALIAIFICISVLLSAKVKLVWKQRFA